MLIFHCLHSTKVPPDGQTEPPLLQFVPVTFCLVIRHHWKESLSPLCTLPSSGICVCRWDAPGLDSPSSLSFSSHGKHCSPFILATFCWSISCSSMAPLGSPELDVVVSILKLYQVGQGWVVGDSKLSTCDDFPVAYMSGSGFQD